MPTKTAGADEIFVERVGGIAGFGAAGSHLKSKGKLALSVLSLAERRLLDDLFKGPVPARTSMEGFRYRITRKVNDTLLTIEVPEEHVPKALQNCVTDTLD